MVMHSQPTDRYAKRKANTHCTRHSPTQPSVLQCNIETAIRKTQISAQFKTVVQILSTAVPQFFMFRHFREIANRDCQLRHGCQSVCPSVRTQHLRSNYTDFHEISYLSIFRKSVEKVQFSLILSRVMVILHKDRYSVLIISRSFLLRMRNVSGQSCRKNWNKHFMPNKVFLKIAFYEVMWENTVEPDRPHIKTRRMRIACWIPNATNTLPEYVIHMWK